MRENFRRDVPEDHHSESNSMIGKAGHTVVGVLLTAAASVGGARAGEAQQPAIAVTADASCTYLKCALSIEPTLFSLDVVRGNSQERVASLNFFLPRSVHGIFAGDDSAVAYAREAFHVRKKAAVLTDLGIVAMGVAGALALREGRVNSDHALIAAGGAALLGISFPLQLRADSHLSRSVWWHNRRFAR